jgi:hypothetical protein
VRAIKLASYEEHPRKLHQSIGVRLLHTYHARGSKPTIELVLQQCRPCYEQQNEEDAVPMTAVAQGMPVEILHNVLLNTRAMDPEVDGRKGKHVHHVHPSRERNYPSPIDHW